MRQVAIVGLGPEGLCLLERLLAEAAATPDRPWVIDLFESHAVPGAGPMYDPAQPQYLRSEQAAAEIAFWETAGDEAEPAQPLLPALIPRQTLFQWARERGYRVGPDDHVARSIVGRYLHDAFRRLCAAAPAHITLTLAAREVVSVRQVGCRWVIEHRPAATGSRRPQRMTLQSGPIGQRPYDQVYVTTVDHQAVADDPQWSRLRSSARRWGHRVIEQIYPARERLSLTEVPPRRSVAIRGVNPAAFDVLLALTEGRGGLFVAAGGPGGCTRRYLRSWREPSRLHLISPSGRLPCPRPTAAVEWGRCDGTEQQVAALGAHGRDVLNRYADGAGDGPVSLWRDCLPLLVDTAVARWQLCHRSRQRTSQGREAHDRVTRWLDRIAAGRRIPTADHPFGPAAATDAWRREAEVAWGVRPLTLRAACAWAWRRFAPRWMGWACNGRMPADESPALRRLARHFGERTPHVSAENVWRVLGLIDAGLVDLTFCRSPRVTVDADGFQLRSARASATCRLLIDTAAAPPLDATGQYLPRRLPVSDGLSRVASPDDASRWTDDASGWADDSSGWADDASSPVQSVGERLLSAGNRTLPSRFAAS